MTTAIASSLLGAWLGRRFGTKRVYLTGLIAGLISMVLLFCSQFLETDTAVAFPLLLVATAFLGAGFGLTVPSLNTLTAAFHQDAIDSAVLVLNALLGLGTALAPVLVAIFVGLGFWWGLPVMSALLLSLLLALSARLPLRTADLTSARPHGRRAGIPPRFWLFAGFATLYGICETVNGNWSQLDMTRELVGHPAVGHLRLDDIVQGDQIVLDGVEEREAPLLSDALRRALDATNTACSVDPSPSANVRQREADAIAHEVAE